MTSQRKEAWTAVLFVSPWIIGFSTFLLYPLIASIYYSFCDYSVLHEPVWIGAMNYTTLIQDEVFWKSLSNTLVYAAMALPMSMLVAISLAMMLNAKVRGMTFYRTIFFVPSLVPAASLAILWLWIFNGKQGVVNAALQPILNGANSLLHLLHIPIAFSAPQWLSDAHWSKPALVLMGVWGCGNAMLIYLAGLQDVPQALYEAAELDGAGWWARTWHVTLPMLSPVIVFNMVMGIIGTLQVFTVPFIMFPGGSPERSTYFYTMYLYDNAFLYLKMGYACAMGWIMFLIILALTFVALRISERRVYYGGS